MSLMYLRSTWPSSLSVSPSGHKSAVAQIFPTRDLRLMLVSLRSTASFSISAQTPSRSRILAIFGASWMPAPTKPRFEAISKTLIFVKPFFARASEQARPPIPSHVLAWIRSILGFCCKFDAYRTLRSQSLCSCPCCVMTLVLAQS